MWNIFKVNYEEQEQLQGPKNASDRNIFGKPSA